jgi:hypothetical protein
MRNLIGFNTPSKVEAQKEMEAKNLPNQNIGMLKAETMRRVDNLNTYIQSEEFKTLPIAQQQALYMDFQYFSAVAQAI